MPRFTDLMLATRDASPERSPSNRLPPEVPLDNLLQQMKSRFITDDMLRLCVWSRIENLFDHFGLIKLNAAMSNPDIQFSNRLDFYGYVQRLRGEEQLASTELFGFEIGPNQFEVYSVPAKFLDDGHFIHWREAKHSVWQEFVNWCPDAWTVGSVNYLNVSNFTPKDDAEAKAHYVRLMEVTKGLHPEPVRRGIHSYEIKALPERRNVRHALLFIEEYDNKRRSYHYTEAGFLSDAELSVVESWHHAKEMLDGEFLFGAGEVYNKEPNEHGPKTDEEKDLHFFTYVKLIQKARFTDTINLPRVPTVVVCIHAGEDPE